MVSAIKNNKNNKIKKGKSLLIKLLFLSALTIANIASISFVKAVVITSDSPLIPPALKGLSAEQLMNLTPQQRTFHLLFVTSATTTAGQTGIEYYDTFVQTAASNNPDLATYTSGFKVLGGTQFIDGHNNTNTNPANHSNGGYPIYFIGGHKAADDYNDFYDSNWDLPDPNPHPLGVNGRFYYYNENGERHLSNDFAWTGLLSNGVKDSTGYLGATSSIIGKNQQNLEFGFSDSNSANGYPLYGLSGTFTMIASTFTIPTVTLNLIGNDPEFVIQATNYIDAGATTTSTETISISTTDNVQINERGRYEVVYTATDTRNNIVDTITRTVYVVNQNRLDIDNNNKIIRANQDGVMIWHYLSGGRDENFMKRAVGKDAKIATPTDLFAYLKYLSERKILDIDASGETDSKDGKLILKYLIGFRGDNLTRGLNLSGTRTLTASITDYFNNVLDFNHITFVWREVTDRAQWPIRRKHSSVASKDKIWVIGGLGFSTISGSNLAPLKDVWSSVDGENWQRETAEAEWVNRRSHSSVSFKNKIWVLGGLFIADGTPEGRKIVNDIWTSSNGATWTQKATETALRDNRWPSRLDHSSVVFKDKMWVLGGIDGDNYFNDVWYSEDGTNWATATDAAQWSKREGHSSVVFKDKIWVLGGKGTGVANYNNEVWFSNESGTIWTQATQTTVATAIWSARANYSSIVFDGKIWVLGGAPEAGVFNDVWSSSDGVHWQQHMNAPWSERHSHSSVVFKDKIWVLGGFDNVVVISNDVWSFGL